MRPKWNHKEYILFADMTAQPEHSQCPLVEMDSITSLFIVYIYDSTTGTFTVSPGGDGFYYFSVFLIVRNTEWAHFDIQINGETLCTAYTDQGDTPSDPGLAACSAATYASDGLLVQTLNIMFYSRNDPQSDSSLLIQQATRSSLST